jgi:pyridoxal phosphate enzyme (YggS family)
VDKNRLAENLQRVRQRMSAACLRAGRNERQAQLVAVTKSVGVEEIKTLYDLGVRDFGENRVPLINEKAAALAGFSDITWHFIGHLQRNKAGKALEATRILHSLESLQLAEVLQKEAEKRGIDTIRIFVEVNISGEESKYGLGAEEAVPFVAKLKDFPCLTLAGLMTMAPYSENPEDARVFFRQLAKLRNKLAPAEEVNYLGLSMGMSGDFETAIEEGATLVRVGSVLFEE